MFPNKWTFSVTIFVGFCLLVLMFQNCSPQQFAKEPDIEKPQVVERCVGIANRWQLVNYRAEEVSCGSGRTRTDRIDLEKEQTCVDDVYTDTGATREIRTEGTCICPRGTTFDSTLNACVTTVSSNVCFNTSADEDGTSAKPWIIRSCACLQAIETNRESSDKSHHFMIGNNFSCSNIENFIPIMSFNGVLDGNNKIISDLSVTGKYAAPFRFLYGTIKNVTFNNFQMSGVDPDALTNVKFGSAAIVTIDAGSTALIENVDITNSIAEGERNVGGVAVDYFGRILNVDARVNVKARRPQSFGAASGDTLSIAGGLVSNLYAGSIKNSSFEGRVEANIVGGVAGYSIGLIENVHMKPEISAPYTYVDAGGIVGHNSGTIKDSTVSSGSSISVVVPSITLQFAQLVRTGGAVGSHSGDITNVTSNMNIDINTNSHPKVFVRAGGLVGMCYLGSPANSSSVSGSLIVRNSSLNELGPVWGTAGCESSNINSGGFSVQNVP